jgi:UDP-glucose 4-epimerase
MKIKCLVTGGCGFIGQNLLRYLLNKEKYELAVLDNLSEGYEEWLPENIEFRNIDIRNAEGVDKFIREFKPEYIFHFASMAAEATSHWLRKYCLDVNCGGTSNVINSAVKHGVNKIIFASSIARYGTGNPPFTESSPINPEDPYGASKIFSEWDLKSAHELFGLNYSIVVPHNVTGGKYQSIWNPYRNALGIWMNQALNKKPITVYGDGLQERAFSDVKFILPSLEKLIDPEFNGQTFNLGADKPYKIVDVAHMVKRTAEKYGYSTNVVHLPERKEVKIAHCDHTKAKNLLDFTDKTNIIETIDEMFLWAENETPKQFVTYKYEIEKNIYDCYKK